MYKTTSYKVVHELENGLFILVLLPLLIPAYSSPLLLPSLTLSNLLISQYVEATIFHVYFIQDSYQLPTESWAVGRRGRKCQQ